VFSGQYLVGSCLEDGKHLQKTMQILPIFFVVAEWGSSYKGFKFWERIKKPKPIEMFFIRCRNLKLLLQCLIFEGALNSLKV
jgi:hypothetical protein